MEQVQERQEAERKPTTEEKGMRCVSICVKKENQGRKTGATAADCEKLNITLKMKMEIQNTKITAGFDAR